MKNVFLVLLAVGGLWLGYRQYKFNLQLEWWTGYTGRSLECDRWENDIPTMAKAQLATKEITKKSFDDWMKNIDEDRRKSCTEFYKFHHLNSGMPFTKDRYDFEKETGLRSVKGYIHDLFNPPFKVDGEQWSDVNPTVILKNHWYGGSPGKCFIYWAEPVKGYPLPGLSRYNYALSCVNDKSIKEGVHGFVAVSTSDNLEKIK